MAEAQAIGAHDRLPWLDTVEGKDPPAARRALVSPRKLLIVAALALFCFALFLVGRWSGTTAGPTAGVAAEGPVAEVALRKIPYPRLTEPEPVLRVDPPPFVTRRPATKAAEAAAAEPPRQDLAEADSRRQIIRLNSAWPGQRRYRWVTPDAAGKPGQALQLGSYPTALEANQQWARLADRYPLLGAMAVTVDPVEAKAGEPSYRLRAVAETQDKAQLACQILRLDGRDCSVLR